MSIVRTIVLAGAGALGYYLYTKMDNKQREQLVEGVKDQLDKALNKIMPRNSRASFETQIDAITKGKSRTGSGFLN